MYLFTNCKQIRNISPFLIRPSVRYLSTFPPGEGMVQRISVNSNLLTYAGNRMDGYLPAAARS